MAKKEVFIERREEEIMGKNTGFGQGQSVLQPKLRPLSARQIIPDAAVLVQRVRDTKVGGRDKWRKP